MANRKRKMVLRCPVTEEERKLIEYKMSLVPTNQIGAYLRKMAIDGYIIYTDTTNIKEMNKELHTIGPISIRLQSVLIPQAIFTVRTLTSLSCSSSSESRRSPPIITIRI